MKTKKFENSLDIEKKIKELVSDLYFDLRREAISHFVKLGKSIHLMKETSIVNEMRRKLKVAGAFSEICEKIQNKLDDQFECSKECDGNCDGCEKLNLVGNAVFNELEDRVENEIDDLENEESLEIEFAGN